MKGAIVMAIAFQQTFDRMKSGTEWEDKTLEDFYVILAIAIKLVILQKQQG